MNEAKKIAFGQSLWEIVIALAIVGLVGLGLVRVISSAVKGVRFSADQTQASMLGQKKIAATIDEKNKNPENFWGTIPFSSEDTANAGYCLVTKVDESALPTTTPDYASAKMAKISVDVFWDEKEAGSECGSKSFQHKLHFETYVTN